MLTNLTSRMGSLIFLPRQQLYPINKYIPSTIISVDHYHHINSTTTVQFQQSTISPQRDELLKRLEFWTVLISLIYKCWTNITKFHINLFNYLFLCYYVAIAYQYLNSSLATVPQVLFINLRDNITKARYQTLPDLVVKGNFPLFFIKLVWGIFFLWFIKLVTTSFMLNLISVKVSFHDIFKKTLNITPVNITSFTV